jgi:quercetin dioxygenase-like cupin family protein
MDIRSIQKIPASQEHKGTSSVWWLVKPREMYNETLGGHLELVSEFELKAGSKVNPHSHPLYEFYYVTSGRGYMQIDDEVVLVSQGDLIKIPPDAVHSMWTFSKNACVRGLIFAVGIKGAPPIDYTDH